MPFPVHIKFFLMRIHSEILFLLYFLTDGGIQQFFDDWMKLDTRINSQSNHRILEVLEHDGQSTDSTHFTNLQQDWKDMTKFLLATPDNNRVVSLQRLKALEEL